MELILFAASASAVVIMTSFDNLGVLLVLMAAAPPRAAVAGYVLSQLTMLALSLLLAEGAAGLLSARAGLLGLVPLGLGLWALWQQRRGTPGPGDAGDLTGAGTPRRNPVLLSAVLFLPLSFDSLAVVSPLLADSAPAFRWAGLWGAAAAVALIAGAALLLTRGPRRAGLVRRLTRIGPFAMIAVGVYILMNTGTDLPA